MPRRRPARSPEAREKQMISLAVDLAEKQLMDGSASTAVITHYLKLASTRERLEKERLEKENELLRAKTESLQNSAKRDYEYQEILKALKSYNGVSDDSDDFYED